jgi:methanethiol S-methyltransferase
MDESPVRGLHRHHAGFLLQWPTLLTVVMFPVLAWAYVRLARREEEEVRATFGEAYARYAAATPAFIPRVKGAAGRRTDARSSHP